MAENTREIVLDILLALEREKLFSNKLIKDVLDKYDYLEVRDKAFIKRAAEGTLERQIELDYYLNNLSSVPVRKMKPLIRCLLRMSAYQILYMDGVPDSAVCNEACKLAGKRKFQNLKGFVNGVLRNLSKNKDNLALPDREREPLRYLSVKYSMPEWLVERWLLMYDCRTVETMLEGLLRVHPVSLRFCTQLDAVQKNKYLADMQACGVKVHDSVYLPYLYQVENVEGIGSLPGYEEGAFVVQDASSALAVEAAGIQDRDFVMDICAAPGGKSMLAAEKAKKVLARDVSENKIALIADNLERMGLTNVELEIYDATQQDETCLEKADVLIMDVPCSGLGVIGKKRDIKYHVSPESLREIVALQRDIVEHSWQYVKPGGILLYSTCTVNAAENEEMVQWIIDNFPFEPEPVAPFLPEKLLEQRSQIVKRRELGASLEEACVQILPGVMDADGFFFARLRRKAE